MTQDKFDDVSLQIIKKVTGTDLLFDVLSKAFGGNDEAFRQAMIDDLTEATLQLENRLGHLEERLAARGGHVDVPKAIQAHVLMREYVEAMADTSSAAKRDALLRGLVRQFDSRIRESTRRYWWDEIRRLDGGALDSLLLLSEGALTVPERGAGPVRQWSSEIVASLAENKINVDVIGSRLIGEFTEADVMALRAILDSMTKARMAEEALVVRNGQIDAGYLAQLYTTTARGAALLDILAEDPPTLGSQ